MTGGNQGIYHTPNTHNVFKCLNGDDKIQTPRLPTGLHEAVRDLGNLESNSETTESNDRLFGLMFQKFRLM